MKGKPQRLVKKNAGIWFRRTEMGQLLYCVNGKTKLKGKIQQAGNGTPVLLLRHNKIVVSLDLTTETFNSVFKDHLR